MQLMIVSVAAGHLESKSLSKLYKLINDGWLDAKCMPRCRVGSACLTLKDCIRRCRTSVSGMSMVFFFERLFDFGCFVFRSFGTSLLGQTLVAEACRTVSKSSSRSF